MPSFPRSQDGARNLPDMAQTCFKYRLNHILWFMLSLELLIELYGAPGEIRTPGLLVRSQTLYPAELRAHTSDSHRIR